MSVIERVRYGHPPTFQAACPLCPWVSPKHPTEDAAERDGIDHHVEVHAT